MKINPNCSEEVFRIKVPTLPFEDKKEKQLIKEIETLMTTLEPYDYDGADGCCSSFVLWDENNNIIFRKRCDGSEEEAINKIKPILKKWKTKMVEIGEQDDVPLYSVRDMFVYKLKDNVKVAKLDYSNSDVIEKIHKKLLKAWKLK